MDNSNVELITKMVLEAVEKKNAAQSGEGFLVPIGVSEDISISHRSMSRFCLEKATILQSSKNLWVDSLHQTKRLQLLVLN